MQKIKNQKIYSGRQSKVSEKNSVCKFKNQQMATIFQHSLPSPPLSQDNNAPRWKYNREPKQITQAYTGG